MKITITVEDEKDPGQHIHIHSIDTKTIIENKDRIADAIRDALKCGHNLCDQIRNIAGVR